MKRILASKDLTLEEIKEAVKTLKENENKPVWRFTKEFPFIKRFYIKYI